MEKEQRKREKIEGLRKPGFQESVNWRSISFLSLAQVAHFDPSILVGVHLYCFGCAESCLSLLSSMLG
jgi:hypothetical protein